MSRPTARVLAMLEILQSGGVHRLSALARQLGVDERTVRRYAEHLLALDIPVESLRGRYGGYRLAPGFRMPPLMLNDDEAVALVLALVAGGGAATGVSARGAAESALSKLRRAMPSRLADRIDALLETTSFTSTPQSERAAAFQPGTSVLLAFAEAAREGHPVEFRYEDRSGRRSRRTLLPVGIVAHSGRWYVSGADSLSGEARTFRLDRVSDAQMLPDRFERQEDADVAALVRATLADTPWQHQVSVLVVGEMDVVAGRLPRGIATVESVAGSVRVRFRAEHLEWIPGMLARLELPFVVEGPPALQELIETVTARFALAAARGRENSRESAS